MMPVRQPASPGSRRSRPVHARSQPASPGSRRTLAPTRGQTCPSPGGIAGTSSRRAGPQRPYLRECHARTVCRRLHVTEVGPDSLGLVVQIHYATGLEVLGALRGVGAAVDRGIVANELSHGVLGLARGLDVVENHAQLVGIQSLVHVRDVAVNHHKVVAFLDNHDGVAQRVAGGGNHAHARGDDLAGGKVVIGAVGELDALDVSAVGDCLLDLVGLELGRGAIDRRLGEAAKLARVVRVLVGQANLGDHVVCVTQVGQVLDVSLYP